MSGARAKVRGVGAAICVLALAGSSCGLSGEDMPRCRLIDAQVLVLEAQSVPSATRLPCIADMPAGWDFGGATIKDTETRLWLNHDRAGVHAVEVTMTAWCDISSAIEIPPAPDEIGMRVYLEPTSLQPTFTGSRYLVFEGGCIAHHYAFTEDADPTLVIEADLALSTLARAEVTESVRNGLDLTLCGAGAPPCVD